MKNVSRKIITTVLLSLCSLMVSIAQPKKDRSFNVIGFFTAKNDKAHISFVHEANKWFSNAAANNKFHYDSTSNWNLLNDTILSKYKIVIFLDTRPEVKEQREAFEHYMKNGGSWIGFHFAGFALTPSAYPQNWNWYHEEFLGAGQYKSNTWRPASANLKVENKKHPTMKGLPNIIRSSPNEWYRWENDLRQNKNIDILLSIDSSSFPLGTGPKPHEIWHSGYYPVMWKNKKYNMVYFNMGHNDIDYENKTNKELSRTFGNEVQDKLVLNTLMWLGRMN
jgi:hypothetical protein